MSVFEPRQSLARRLAHDLADLIGTGFFVAVVLFAVVACGGGPL